MRVLLVSTYELGHQPLHLASPRAALIEAGHDVRTLDTSVERWDASLVDWAHAVAFSVPMHTAMRLAMLGAEAVKQRRPDVPVCFYGLYAHVSRDTTTARLVDRVFAGEYEAALVDWVSALGSSSPVPESSIELKRGRTRLPVRDGLPKLKKYAHLAMDGEERVVGYVEASRGCVHRCRHCPVPVVYDGRTRKVAVDVVLDDIAQLVERGARHITFGDPDFLNRWAHSMKIVELLHQRFPELTFDVTTKVSHLLRYASLVPLLAEQGCLFVVSAYECVNDDILGYLDKGHTRAQAEEATQLLRAGGIEPRPSWLPFMPWTTVDDVADILDFVVRHDLIGNVDPVQYTIRLLIPEGSLMLGVPEIEPYLGPYDAENLTYTWRAADERTVGLQQRLAQLVEDSQQDGKTITEIFCDVRDAVLHAAGRPAGDRELILAGSTEGRPRLTEPWFC
ncbi:MAG TPA: CUAEP/CCAEP-tail radical SAM protein [Actinomycetota bacterium]|nr:CUAEP/CCAEP-tail radical SAM protein [Actinomycetota bacterium]